VQIFLSYRIAIRTAPETFWKIFGKCCWWGSCLLVLNVCSICSPLLIVKVIFVITVFFLFFMCFYTILVNKDDRNCEKFCVIYECRIHVHRPEEILSTVEFAVSGETSFAEAGFAVDALHAADVPGSVKDVEQEPVDDRPLTASAYHHHRSTSPPPWCSDPQARMTTALMT